MLIMHLVSMPWLRRLNAIMTRWQRLIGYVLAPYRPELHYMRGPGPKWHAKRRGRGQGDAL